MKEIKIISAETYSNWVGKPLPNKINHTIAAITKDDGNQFFIDFSEDDISEIMVILKIKGYGGHIDLHDWLKNFKNKTFDQHIHDTDSEQLVINLLMELKKYYNIEE